MQKTYLQARLLLALLAAFFFLFPSFVMAADNCKIIVDNFKFCEDEDWSASTREEILENPLFSGSSPIGDTLVGTLISFTILREKQEQNFFSGIMRGLNGINQPLSSNELIETLYLNELLMVQGRESDVEIKTFTNTKVKGDFPIVRVSYFFQRAQGETSRFEYQPVHVVQFISQHMYDKDKSILLTSLFFDPLPLSYGLNLDPSIDLEDTKLPLGGLIDTHRSMISRFDYEK